MSDTPKAAAGADGVCVTADALACRRGLRPLFASVSFALRRGEALALTGPNGSGKTSLLRQLAGLLPVEAGTVRIELPLPALHFLGHADGLKSALTLHESLRFAAAMQGVGLADEKAAALLAELGLAGRFWQRIGDLSAGQRRRLALADLMLAPRPLWLLDEPLTALDADGRALINRLAAAHLAEGGVIIASSHAPLAFADRTLDLGDHAVAMEPA